MPLPPFLICWGIRFLRAIFSNSNSPHFGVFLRGSQDPLKLPVDRFPSFGRVSPWSAGKLDGRIRGGVLPDPVEAFDQQPDGLAVLAVVLEQRLSEPLVPGGFPAVPPGQAQEA
jgi:hypothetical protein